MSTPWPAAMAPTVSPGTTVYRLGSPAGSGGGAGAGAGSGCAGAGAGTGSAGGAGAAAAGAAAAGASAAGAAAAPEPAWTAGIAAALGDAGAAASATWATVVVLPLVDGGAARAPTPTAATTAAVAMPAHNLLLMTGRPVLRSVRGSSVAKLLLEPSREGRGDWFMGCPSGFGPARALRCRPGAGRSEMPLRPAAPAGAGAVGGAGLEASAHPEDAELRVKAGTSGSRPGDPPVRGGPRSPESRNRAGPRAPVGVTRVFRAGTRPRQSCYSTMGGRILAATAGGVPAAPRSPSAATRSR